MMTLFFSTWRHSRMTYWCRLSLIALLSWLAWSPSPPQSYKISTTTTTTTLLDQIYSSLTNGKVMAFPFSTKERRPTFPRWRDDLLLLPLNLPLPSSSPVPPPGLGLTLITAQRERERREGYLWGFSFIVVSLCLTLLISYIDYSIQLIDCEGCDWFIYLALTQRPRHQKKHAFFSSFLVKNERTVNEWRKERH